MQLKIDPLENIESAEALGDAGEFDHLSSHSAVP